MTEVWAAIISRAVGLMLFYFRAVLTIKYAERLDTALANETEGSDFAIGDAVGLVSADDAVLDWNSDGNCIIEDIEISATYSGWRALNGTIFATSRGDALYIDPSMTTASGYTLGRLRVYNPDSDAAAAELTPLYICHSICRNSSDILSESLRNLPIPHTSSRLTTSWSSYIISFTAYTKITGARYS